MSLTIEYLIHGLRLPETIYQWAGETTFSKDSQIFIDTFTSIGLLSHLARQCLMILSNYMASSTTPVIQVWCLGVLHM